MAVPKTHDFEAGRVVDLVQSAIVATLESPGDSDSASTAHLYECLHQHLHAPAVLHRLRELLALSRLVTLQPYHVARVAVRKYRAYTLRSFRSITSGGTFVAKGSNSKGARISFTRIGDHYRESIRPTMPCEISLHSRDRDRLLVGTVLTNDSASESLGHIGDTVIDRT